MRARNKAGIGPVWWVVLRTEYFRIPPTTSLGIGTREAFRQTCQAVEDRGAVSTAARPAPRRFEDTV